jgi:hypothetical protein
MKVQRTAKADSDCGWRPAAEQGLSQVQHPLQAVPCVRACGDALELFTGYALIDGKKSGGELGPPEVQSQ